MGSGRGLTRKAEPPPPPPSIRISVYPDAIAGFCQGCGGRSTVDTQCGPTSTSTVVLARRESAGGGPCPSGDTALLTQLACLADS